MIEVVINKIPLNYYENKRKMVDSPRQNRRWPRWEIWDTQVPDCWYSLRSKNQQNLACWQIVHRPRHNFDCIDHHDVECWIDSRQQHGAVECYKSALRYASSCLQLSRAGLQPRVHVEIGSSSISLSVWAKGINK